ncbi:MAG TPA: glycogen debranching N-terminal domain-containing protein [Stenomitos sp.]
MGGPLVLQDVNRLKMFPETLVAYQGHSICITGVHGHVKQGIEGFYQHNTRFLSRMIARVDGCDPHFVSANPVDAYSFIAYYLCPHPGGREAGPPDDPDPTGGEIVKSAIELQVNRFVGNGMHQDVCLTNHALSEAEVELEWEFDADYADLTEAVEGKRTQFAPVEVAWQEGELRFAYRHPELPHATLVRFLHPPTPPEYRDGRVVMRLKLPPRVPVEFCITVHPVFCGERQDPLYDCYSFRSRDTDWDRARMAWGAQLPTLHASHPLVQSAWDRAVADLGSLFLFDGTGAERYTPAAGVPIYQALFGRDTLTTAWQSSLLNPLMLKGTIETMARWLGDRTDDRYDEQPGRIIHQRQLNPLSLLGKNPFLHYYGDYAGPPMFLTCIAWYFMQTGDREFVRGLMEPIERVLAWMDRDGDRDGDGFYEYATRAGAWGTKNQGWKDSGQAVLYPDGRMVQNPIASVEIQGYCFVAKQLMGQTFLALGHVARGVELIRAADDLKRRFNEAYWWPEEGFYAQALDPEKRQVRTVTSNPGHCLSCGIVDQGKAAAVGGRLMAPDMFSGWGIRTLSSDHPAFNPFAYHLGSVWPPENASIALGLKRYGLNRLLHKLARGLFEATGIFYLHRLPESIGGHPRDAFHPHPGIYPQSNAPQAWSSSAVIMLVHALLGLRPYAPLNALLIDPDLPEWLPEVTLEHLPLGSSRVSLRLRRDASGHTDYQILESSGRPHVLRQPPANSLRANLFDRLGDLVETLLPH